MKRLIVILAVVLVSAATATVSAQNYMVIDSEKIFKSLDDYNKAIASLDALAKDYQKQVDAKFEEVETLYNNYINQKNSLSAASRQAYENSILSKEKAATEFQQSIFDKEGTLMKKRLEMIEPIQKRVFAAIDAYAVKHGFDLVMDSASNPTLLYNSAKINHTQGVIDALK